MAFTLTGGMIPRTVKRMFDQRSEPRADAARQSSMLMLRGRPHIVELVNVSPSGAMVIFPQIPHIGEAVTLQLRDSAPVEGHVRWVRDGCIGINFVSPLAGAEE